MKEQELKTFHKHSCKSILQDLEEKVKENLPSLKAKVFVEVSSDVKVSLCCLAR